MSECESSREFKLDDFESDLSSWDEACLACKKKNPLGMTGNWLATVGVTRVLNRYHRE